MGSKFWGLAPIGYDCGYLGGAGKVSRLGVKGLGIPVFWPMKYIDLDKASVLAGKIRKQNWSPLPRFNVEMFLEVRGTGPLWDSMGGSSLWNFL